MALYESVKNLCKPSENLNLMFIRQKSAGYFPISMTGASLEMCHDIHFNNPIVTYVHPLLDNASLRLAVVHLPVGLAVLHVLQLQSEGGYVLLALQQKDPSALVQTRGFTDPHVTLIVAHTCQVNHQTYDIYRYKILSPTLFRAVVNETSQVLFFCCVLWCPVLYCF